MGLPGSWTWSDGGGILWHDQYRWSTRPVPAHDSPADAFEYRDPDSGLIYDYFDPFVAYRYGQEGESPSNYGWHYEWDDVRQRWRRSHGWFEDRFESPGVVDSPSVGRRAAARDRGARRMERDHGSSGTEVDGAETAVAGRITGFRTLTLRGSREPHLVVRLTTAQGERRIVDLGRRSALGDLHLERGDSIAARGQRRRTAQGVVLVAESILRDGEIITLAGARTDRSAGDRDAGRGQRRLSGRVDAVRRVRPDGLDQHLVLEVALENGATRFVDFGRGTTLRELDLRSGDEVRIVGQPVRNRGDSTLLRADDVLVDGERIDLGADDSTQR